MGLLLHLKEITLFPVIMVTNLHNAKRLWDFCCTKKGLNCFLNLYQLIKNVLQDYMAFAALRRDYVNSCNFSNKYVLCLEIAGLLIHLEETTLYPVIVATDIPCAKILRDFSSTWERLYCFLQLWHLK